MRQIGLLSGILAVLVSPIAAKAVEKNCEFCHEEHRGGYVLLNKNITALCSGCHNERLQTGEHKVGMSPPMVVRELPLQAGKMTCITCHDPHSKAAAMLRMASPELCGSCHTK
ncbi:MAG: cytochrome c3 family protein [Nitrospiraceae bacterium]|nr:cytochrome c3 family protein [Nitrospiraceae bacterium]